MTLSLAQEPYMMLRILLLHASGPFKVLQERQLILPEFVWD